MFNDAAGELEGIADHVLMETGCDEPPVCALETASCVGLRIVDERHHRGHGRLSRDTIYVDMSARRVRVQGIVAHETAHHLLKIYGAPNTEPNARYLGGALLVPRREIDRDLRSTWNPLELQRRHVNASVELIAKRIVAVRDAVVSVFDNGKLRSRVASPWLTVSEKPSAFERELARAVFESGEAQHPDELLLAVPVFRDDWRRVVVVAEAEQLSLRL